MKDESGEGVKILSPRHVDGLKEVMKKNKSVMLILSDICTAECPICYASCSPRNQNIMNECLMKASIDQAKENDLAKCIAFGGGEPFARYKLLKKGLEYAKEKGCITRVFTNGFWGKWTDSELMKKIEPLPIDEIIFSADSYHERFVSVPDLNRAVAVIKKTKISSLDLWIGETKTSEPIHQYFHKVGSFKYFVKAKFYPYIRVGRATELPFDDFYRLISVEDVQCAANDTIAVRYDGEVFPCAEFVTHDAAFSLGNLTISPLSEIIKNHWELLSLLRETGGLAKLVSMVRDELHGEFPERYGSGCEICYSILKDKEVREKVIYWLKKSAL